MRLIIQPNYDEVSEWVAKYVVRRINLFAPTADKPFVLGEYVSLRVADRKLFLALEWRELQSRSASRGRFRVVA